MFILGCVYQIRFNKSGLWILFPQKKTRLALTAYLLFAPVKKYRDTDFGDRQGYSFFFARNILGNPLLYFKTILKIKKIYIKF